MKKLQSEASYVIKHFDSNILLCGSRVAGRNQGSNTLDMKRVEKYFED